MKTFSKALITGATSGIGEALAELIESKKIPTLLIGRKIDAIENLKGEKLKLDLVEDRTALIEMIKKEVPDLVINNAGFGLYGDAVDLSIKEQLEMVNVNCQALLEITLTAADVLKKTGKKGTILNVSSAASFQPYPTLAVYAATKAFVTNLSESLDEELSPYGIRVLVSCPGRISTNFSSRAAKGKSKSSHTSMTSDYAAKRIWSQIEAGKRKDIYDFKTHLGVRFAQFILPNSLITRILPRQS